MTARLYRLITGIALIASPVCGASFTPIDAGTRLRSTNFLQEIYLSWAERESIVPRNTNNLSWTVTNGYQVADLGKARAINDLQHYITNKCTAYLPHGDLGGSVITNEPSNYTLSGFLAATGMTNGFRRFAETNGTWPADWKDYDDTNFSYGQIRSGDIVGPWIWQDIQIGLDGLRWIKPDIASVGTKAYGATSDWVTNDQDVAYNNAVSNYWDNDQQYPPIYDSPFRPYVVGIACGAYSKLPGGDPPNDLWYYSLWRAGGYFEVNDTIGGLYSQCCMNSYIELWASCGGYPSWGQRPSPPQGSPYIFHIEGSATFEDHDNIGITKHSGDDEYTLCQTVHIVQGVTNPVFDDFMPTSWNPVAKITSPGKQSAWIDHDYDGANWQAAERFAIQKPEWSYDTPTPYQ